MSASGNSSGTPSSPQTAQQPAFAKPDWHQLLVNLKVWAPYFSNRVDRDRVVRFSAVDDRVGLKWGAAMPRQCWSCGSQEKLTGTEFKRVLRAYENPLAILSAMTAGVGLGLLLLVIFPGIFTFLLLAAVVTVGLLILRLKSWEEDVRLVFWSCPEHVEELKEPDLVIDDQQLCVMSPSFELADAARVAIRAKRKRGLKPYDTGGESAEEPPERSRRAPAVVEEQPVSSQRPQPVDLPPIRLAGEEDDAPA